MLNEEEGWIAEFEAVGEDEVRIGSIAAPAYIRRQNFTRRSVGCASRQCAKPGKKNFSATFGGRYVPPSFQ
jgi:hypothetical protein